MLRKIIFYGSFLIFIFLVSFFIILQLQQKEYKIIKETTEKQVNILVTELNNKIEFNMDLEIEKLNVLAKLVAHDVNNLIHFNYIAYDKNQKSYLLLISNEGKILTTFPKIFDLTGASILDIPDVADFFIQMKKKKNKNLAFLSTSFLEGYVNKIKKTFIAFGVPVDLNDGGRLYLIKMIPYNVFFDPVVKQFNHILGESAVIYLKEKTSIPDAYRVFEYNINGLKYFIVIKKVFAPTIESLENHFKKINALIIFLLSITFILGALIIFNLFNSNTELEKLVEKRANELNLEKEKYELFFNNLPLAATVYDMENLKIEEANDNAKIFGFDVDRIMDKCLDENKQFYEHLEEVKEKEYGFSVISKTDGKIFELYSIKLAKENKILTIIKDITEQKRIEDKLQQTQRFELITTITSGISHDFKNTLNNIQIYLSLLDKDKANLDQYLSTLKKITSSAKEHIDNLLMLSKQRRPQIRRITTEKLMKSFIQIVSSYVPQHIDISYVNLVPQAKVKVAKGSLHQAFLNIIVNAVEAIGSESGNLSIVVDREKVNEINFVKITFNDTGPGIDEKDIKNVFKPFFTTKKDGCGLGLALVDRVVKELGGFVSIESVKNEGTTVRIFLPEIA